MPTPFSNPPGGYSWMGVSVPGSYQERTKELTEAEKKRLDDDCKTVEATLHTFENKIHHYNSLCKRYKKLANTDRAGELVKQMEHLRKEIDAASHQISKSLDDTSTITHPQNDH